MSRAPKRRRSDSSQKYSVYNNGGSVSVIGVRGGHRVDWKREVPTRIRARWSTKITNAKNSVIYPVRDHPHGDHGWGAVAPGHLGELTQHLSYEMVDDALRRP